MAKQIHKLTALKAQMLSKPGWYADGQGLYLQVNSSISKSWVYRYEKSGKERRHGLGSFPAITLKAAREKALECKALRTNGYDPIDYKHKLVLDQQIQQAKDVNFKTCALAYINSHKAGWKNRKHESQWHNTLETYAYPVIGNLSVQDIDTSLVMKVLEPIWFNKTETATRVRQRIENVLDWAKVQKYRTGENPALWRGHLDKLLPKRSKVQKVKHHSAMAYDDLPDYFRDLRKIQTIAAKALTFAVLTATRTNETRQAKWSEIDLLNGVWTIPDVRMKMDKEHRVPLAPECIKILEELKQHKVDDHVFPGNQLGKSISNNALLALLKQTHPTITVHGFRSTFRDWCAEITNFQSEIAEAALAHTIANQTQAAYERGDKFEKRRKLMNAWTTYCLKGKKTSNIVPIYQRA